MINEFKLFALTDFSNYPINTLKTVSDRVIIISPDSLNIKFSLNTEGKIYSNNRQRSCPITSAARIKKLKTSS